MRGLDTFGKMFKNLFARLYHRLPLIRELDRAVQTLARVESSITLLSSLQARQFLEWKKLTDPRYGEPKRLLGKAFFLPNHAIDDIEVDDRHLDGRLPPQKLSQRMSQRAFPRSDGTGDDHEHCYRPSDQRRIRAAIGLSVGVCSQVILISISNGTEMIAPGTDQSQPQNTNQTNTTSGLM